MTEANPGIGFKGVNGQTTSHKTDSLSLIYVSYLNNNTLFIWPNKLFICQTPHPRIIGGVADIWSGS